MENTKMISFVQACIVGILAAVACAVMVVIYENKTQAVVQQAVGSPAGAIFNQAKVATIVFTPSSATSTFILNGDVSDRVIQSATVWCTGAGASYTPFTYAGLGAFNFLMATSSSNTAASFVNAVPAAGLIFSNNIATTTSFSYVASTTSFTSTAATRDWAAGTYLAIFTNATNTAQCVAGVNYLGS